MNIADIVKFKSQKERIFEDIFAKFTKGTKLGSYSKLISDDVAPPYGKINKGKSSRGDLHNTGWRTKHKSLGKSFGKGDNLNFA